ncbi:SapC family protein [Thalassotalea psychrophila]|uniref:SapC family protein n=1 Tax=Thalassotalea psychrophila TaxID=3065647 RepID=A0ABY9TZJ2_9GAMM|nr:SapC family protein [Colwelliaceae bacterium SQ149]
MKLEKLDSNTHINTKVLAFTDVTHSFNAHLVHTVPQEFKNIAQHYPIFFAKNEETGQFSIITLLGLRINENLFINEGKWQGGYLPLNLQTEPFFLIEDEQEVDGKLVSKPALAIDVNNSRVQTTQGEAVFKQGKATTYLQDKANLLAQFVEGTRFNNEFIKALLEQNLLEPVNLDITLESGEDISLQGLYTINKEVLVRVPATAQQEFERLGYVQLMTDILASLNNVEALIDLKNKKLKAGKL